MGREIITFLFLRLNYFAIICEYIKFFMYYKKCALLRGVDEPSLDRKFFYNARTVGIPRTC